MSDHSNIEWTDATWPVVVGCDRISPGCANCYAVRDGNRLAGNPNEKVARVYGGLVERQGNGQLDWTGVVRCVEERLDWPLKWSKPRRIFICSQSDLFHEDVPDAFLDRVFAVMALAPQHTFQVLTKRAERVRDYLTAPIGFSARRNGRVWTLANDLRLDPRYRGASLYNFSKWPLPNVWLGVSVENQQYADARIPLLLQTPAAVRFLSVEPLLGPVDLRAVAMPDGDALGESLFNHGHGAGIDLAIVGGESGPGARPMHPDWPRSIRDQCVAAGVKFFFKQWGEYQNGSSGSPSNSDRIVVTDGRAFTWEEYAAALSQTPDHLNPTIMARVGKKAAGRLLDGRTWDEMPEART